jgi:hypothetical protein
MDNFGRIFAIRTAVRLDPGGTGLQDGHFEYFGKELKNGTHAKNYNPPVITTIAQPKMDCLNGLATGVQLARCPGYAKCVGLVRQDKI